MRTDGHGHRQHGGHGDGDPADEQHEQVVDSVAVLPVLDRVHDDDLDQHPDRDGADAEVPDRREHLHATTAVPVRITLHVVVWQSH